MPTGNYLDAIAFGLMPAGEYWHVFQKQHGGPLDSNPNSKARLAIPSGIASSAPIVGMYYAATSAVGALFEAVLRSASLYPGRSLYLDRGKLAGYSIAQIQLKQDIAVIPLSLPDRKMVIYDPVNEQRWRGIVNSMFYDEGQLAAAAVHAEVTNAGYTMNGFRWTSVQAPAFGDVYLLYVPATDPPNWRLPHKATVLSLQDLDTKQGEQYISEKLARCGYHWLSDPDSAAHRPPAGAI